MLEDRLRLPASEIQSHSSSLLAAHAISSVIFCPIAGILMDKCSGRKLPYLTGVFVLLLATVLFFLGSNMAALIIARILQGSSGALMWTGGQAILIDTVGAENVGKATGSIFGTISIGVLAAPVLGGILYHKTGVTGPLALGCSLLGVDLIMRLLMVEKKIATKFGFGDGDPAEQRPHSEDTREVGPDDPLLKKPQDPAYIIPLEQPRMIKSCPILYCFKNVRLLTANWITLIQATILGALDATVPTVGEEYYDFNSLQTGLLFIPILVPGLILGPVAGGITDRQGPKTIVVLGFGLLVPIFILLRIAQPGGLVEVLIYCFLLTLCGTCLAFTNPPALVESTLVIEKYHKANPEIFGPNGPYAQVSSITGFTYNAGTALGSLLAGALKDAIGYGNMNLVTAALSLITALLGFLYTGEKPADTPADTPADWAVSSRSFATRIDSNV
ncbi:MAG: hypothetical protein Q9167_000037 [Letrouitia subvulpina]